MSSSNSRTESLFSIFDIVAVLLAVTATFAWINHVVLRLPNTIGLLTLALLSSFALAVLETSFPTWPLFRTITSAIKGIDFTETLLQGMLSYLLFTGALQVDLSALRDRKIIVGSMSSIGVCISTVLIGVLFWWASALFDAAIPLIWCLVFGALISPTDPVAVLSTLKSVKLPKRLEVDIAGESLFNDGIGVVLFTVLLAAATTNERFGAGRFAEVLVVEAVGGGLLGFATGYIAYRAMRQIDQSSIEVLISLAVVTGSYALATQLQVSGPIAVVVAGVIIGNTGAEHAMSDRTTRYMFGFWQLVDEMLNSVLFLLIGLEVLVMGFDPGLIALALIAIPITLLARFIAVAVPIKLLSLRYPFEKSAIAMLTWGGARGGISIALVLAIPNDVFRAPLAASTYTVAVFTIIGQGLTLPWLARRMGIGKPEMYFESAVNRRPPERT